MVSRLVVIGFGKGKRGRGCEEGAECDSGDEQRQDGEGSSEDKCQSS
jgi:hypothetical protein